jgi:hypothetical protein
MVFELCSLYYNGRMSTVEKLRRNGISFRFDELRRVAQAYHIADIAVFGSSLREDMSSASDLDLLVSFTTDANISLFDLMDLERELGRVFGSPVHIVEPESLTNPVRRRSILSSTETLYEAQ